MSDKAELNQRHPIPQPRPLAIDVPSVIEDFAHQMMYSLAKDEHTASDYDVFYALALAVRDRLMERWFATQKTYYRADTKRVYYLSLEFLTGRLLTNNMISLGSRDVYSRAMKELGYRLEELRDSEPDHALGNGGLGRLAACFLDSAATLALPFYGYGIRYEYGIFRQHIIDGFQQEAPDNWLRFGNPWEIPRPDVLLPVRFYGRIAGSGLPGGKYRFDWVDTEDVYAMAYDMPIAGFRNDTVNSLRLWAAKSSHEFDLSHFNAGEYVRAVEHKNATENISKVLYPVDDRYVGKELRLKQQYFFVSATLQDVIRRFKKRPGRTWNHLPDLVAMQLNDTHPAVAIPELMRVLIDDEGLGWDTAWEISEKVFGYTNHTVLPEALESWSTEFFGRLLPRHLQLIEEIDRRIRKRARDHFRDQPEKVQRVAIIDEHSRTVRMANLAIVGSHAVNGVARLHTQLLKSEIFPELDELYPGRFSAKTNGVTPRRWLLEANPLLAELVTEAIGDGWVRDLDELRNLRAFADDAGFRERWRAIKRRNKEAFANWVKEEHGIALDPDTMFDVQVKRIHEYKRQLLNVLHVIALYHRIRDGERPASPRTVLFGGKAAPSYSMAKLIIKLVNSVANLIHGDPETRDHLRVFFVPDYRVTVAEKIFPATDLSEQISTAGTEASGTGNMKAALNGALTIGTLDGANVEIRDEVGEENLFIFGHTTDEIAALRAEGYEPRKWVEQDPELARVLEMLAGEELESGNPALFRPIVDNLLGHDRFFVCADFGAYVAMQKKAGEAYARPEEWTQMAIRTVAAMGRFSSDRTIREYAREIWKVDPVPIQLDRAGLDIDRPVRGSDRENEVAEREDERTDHHGGHDQEQ